MDEKTAPVIFSEWLKRRRKALDLTQGELAQRAGCSVAALRKIESGERRPSKQLAALLARALEIPTSDQQTFIRVARGELNLERLGEASTKTPGPLPEVSDLLQSHQSLSSKESSGCLENRIPSQTTPLVGREGELTAMERIFNDPQCHLLTLIGVGGIGKTRLAIEYACRNVSGFPGGIFYIPLTPVYTTEEIVPTIADVLDFSFSGPSDPKEQLFSYIKSNINQPALLILDNLEQLLIQTPGADVKSGLVELICEILQRLSNVKILGTSRERLNLYGEWTYELHGLSIPPHNVASRLEDYSSAALFIKSAQRIRADFQVADNERESLVQICEIVEGVPLAIELAAAWVGVLSCREIAQEIQSNMDFLTTSMRDVPERHRSIRATFDHSWSLLSEGERCALSQLSVFQGGFDRFAAQQVAGASLPLLASLSAKSLVRRSDSGRYDLHEVIRQYSLSHLKEQPRYQETYNRHCEHYLKMVQEREKALKTAEQQGALRELTGEIDNIRAAWAWAINHEEYSLLGQAGRAYGWYYEIAGLYREGIEQLELLVQALKNGPHQDEWQRILGLASIHQALLSFRRGEFERALDLYENSIDILRPIGDQPLLADALIFSGTIRHLIGDYEQAKANVEEGLAFARAANVAWFEAFGIFDLGYIACLEGRYAEGYKQLQRSVDIWRTLGDPHAIALGLNFLVPTLITLGRYGEAKSSMHESIALCEQSKNRWGMGTAYRYLGLAYLAEGAFTEAHAHLLKSLEIFGEFSIGWDIARSLTYLGDAARMSGDYAGARRYYLDGLRLSIESKAPPIALDALVGLGHLFAQAGKIGHAKLLCDYILNHPSGEAGTKQRAEELCTGLGDKLTPEQETAVHRPAGEMTLESIMDKLLQSELPGE